MRKFDIFMIFFLYELEKITIRVTDIFLYTKY